MSDSTDEEHRRSFAGADWLKVELHQIVRFVRCDQGQVALRLHYEPRPSYGRESVSLERRPAGARLAMPDARLDLSAPMELEVTGGRAAGVLLLREGEERAFVLSYICISATSASHPNSMQSYRSVVSRVRCSLAAILSESGNLTRVR